MKCLNGVYSYTPAVLLNLGLVQVEQQGSSLVSAGSNDSNVPYDDMSVAYQRNTSCPN